MGCNGNKEGIGLQGVSYCCNVDSRGGGGPRVSRRVIECRKVLRRSTIGNWGIDITSCLFLRMHHRGIALRCCLRMCTGERSMYLRMSLAGPGASAPRS